jgi:hypothetical protein
MFNNIVSYLIIINEIVIHLETLSFISFFTNDSNADFFQKILRSQFFLFILFLFSRVLIIKFYIFSILLFINFVKLFLFGVELYFFLLANNGFFIT